MCHFRLSPAWWFSRPAHGFWQGRSLENTRVVAFGMSLSRHLQTVEHTYGGLTCIYLEEFWPWLVSCWFFLRPLWLCALSILELRAGKGVWSVTIRNQDQLGIKNGHALQGEGLHQTNGTVYDSLFNEFQDVRSGFGWIHPTILMGIAYTAQA